MTEVKQFGNSQPVRFKIGNVEFEAVPEVAADVMLEFADLKDKLSETDDVKSKINTMAGIFKDILSTESYDRLVAGLKSRKKPGDVEGVDPIGLHTLVEVIEWMFGEAYGKRPTQPPQS